MTFFLCFEEDSTTNKACSFLSVIGLPLVTATARQWVVACCLFVKGPLALSILTFTWEQ